MTEQMAIEILKNTTDNIKVYDDDVTFTYDFAKAYEMAIQALEKQSMVNEILNELQQYRAIGTVEELDAMKENISYTNDGLKRLKEYQSLGTVEELQALKEKSVAKKPIKKQYVNCWVNEIVRITQYRCPHCNERVNNDYCANCGTKIDWE